VEHVRGQQVNLPLSASADQNCRLYFKAVNAKLLNLRAYNKEHFMLKRIFSLSLLLVASGFFLQCTAQNASTITERLSARFSADEQGKMSTDELAFWDFFSTQGFEVFTITKDLSQSDMKTIAFKGDLGSINPLALGLTPEETAVNTYKLGDTNTGLMILSKEKIVAKMNRQK
jgi:hypothetical protein